MKNKIISEQHGDKREWFVTTAGQERISLSELLGEDIIDCWWQDTAKNFIVAFYSAWDSTELYAIFDQNGRQLRKGMSEIIEFLEDKSLFLLRFEGRWLESDQSFYSVPDDTWKMAVVCADGKYLIEPLYDRIFFDPEQKLFVCSHGVRIDLSGKLVAS